MNRSRYISFSSSAFSVSLFRTLVPLFMSVGRCFVSPRLLFGDFEPILPGLESLWHSRSQHAHIQFKRQVFVFCIEIVINLSKWTRLFSICVLFYLVYSMRPTQFRAIFGFAHFGFLLCWIRLSLLASIVTIGWVCFLGIAFFLLLLHCVASRTHSICCCCVSLYKHQSFMYPNFIKAFRVLYVVFTQPPIRLHRHRHTHTHWLPYTDHKET